MIVRPAELNDIPALAAIAQESYSQAFSAILEPAVVADYDVAFFVERFARAWERLLVLCADAGPVGFLLMTAGHIDMLFVAHAVHGQGGGALLLQEAETRGARSLECFRDNHGARRFYERQGWRVTREYERDFAGHPRSFVFYEKERGL